MSNSERWLQIVQKLLEQPTAAIREELPQAYIREFAREHPALALSQDASGNLMLGYSVSSAQSPPLVMVAHLDHPGFWVQSVSGSTAELLFKGGVDLKHAKEGSPVRFFAPGDPSPISVGMGTLGAATGEKGRLERATANIKEGRAIPGGFAMWDFPGFSLNAGLIVSRCCDDLLGAAAALCVLDEIAARKPGGIGVWALFTGAEEIGFYGALEAIRHGTVPKNACVLSLECSKALSNASQGEGVIVRVGDKASIFDPELSEALRRAAAGVAKSDPNFKYQRKLMDGGSCEASAFCGYGYRASGLALPLGNYHNQGFDTAGNPEIGPESVNLADFMCEIQLLIELAMHPELLCKTSGAPGWLETRAQEARAALGGEVSVDTVKTRDQEM